MNMTPAAILKAVKQLEQQKSSILYEETMFSSYEIVENGTAVEPPEYNFTETTRAVTELDGKIKALKCALNKHNVNSIVSDTGCSPSELLIWIAQLNSALHRVSDLAATPQKRVLPFSQTRGDFSSIVKITQIANYDVKEAKKLQKELTEKIASLQMALDTHNLTQMVEVDVEL